MRRPFVVDPRATRDAATPSHVFPEKIRRRIARQRISTLVAARAAENGQHRHTKNPRARLVEVRQASPRPRIRRPALACYDGTLN